MRRSFPFFLAVAAVALPFASALATPTVTSLTAPLTQAQFQALNGTGAEYGPPSNATFPDGPFTVASGTSVNLTGGPAAESATTVLLVLSADDVMELGAGTIGLQFTDTANNVFNATFDASDFFTTSEAGFPDNINGIANGAVNGIKFPDAVHAGADLTFNSVLEKDAVLGSVAITSPIDLRVDVFGDANGLIVGNAANSGAEGITGGMTPVPEPGEAGLFLLGLAGAFFGYRRLRRGS